jgi:ABC-type multidrug transport system ATPase subunit
VTPGMSASILTTDFGTAVARATGDSRRRKWGVASAGAVLVMEGVCKTYEAGARGCRGVVRVLDGASLRVGAGEIVGVVGGEGVGKSTLLLCAAGVVKVERGRVWWGDGEDWCGERALSRPRYLDLGGRSASRDVRDAMASGAALVLLDHASEALLSELRGMLAQWRPRGARPSAVVVTSRSRAELARLVSRVLVLRDGRLAEDEALRTCTGSHASGAPSPQRKRSAARASSELPAAFARVRIRST